MVADKPGKLAVRQSGMIYGVDTGHNKVKGSVYIRLASEVTGKELSPLWIRTTDHYQCSEEGYLEPCPPKNHSQGTTGPPFRVRQRATAISLAPRLLNPPEGPPLVVRRPSYSNHDRSRH